jgi:hypothetical protein
MKILSDKIGNLAFQSIECQRPLSSMIEPSLIDDFYNQRVDFSLETEKTKIVIEIDGDQHKEENQHALDLRRQAALEKNNWTVFRIPARNIRENRVDKILDKIEKIYEQDPLLHARNTNDLRTFIKDTYATEALKIILTPIAVARLQWTLIWAFMNGVLSLNDPTIKLAIIELDIPCVLIAIEDFIYTLTKLKQLARIESKIPKFDVQIVRNIDFITFTKREEKDQTNSLLNYQVSEKEHINEIFGKKYDLVIDLSTLHIGPTSDDLYLAQNEIVKICSVFSSRAQRTRFYSAAPITYDADEVYSQTMDFFLQWFFRNKNFLDGQREILQRSLSNKDVIGLLPTGGGKCARA